MAENVKNDVKTETDENVENFELVPDEPRSNKGNRKKRVKKAPAKEKPELVEGQIPRGYAKQARELDKITKNINVLLEKERGMWWQTFTLMEEVSEKKLYLARGFTSFTKWLNWASENTFRVNTSLLWKRLKAGRFQTRYMERREAAGLLSEADKNLDVSPDTLVLIEKTAGGNEHIEDAMIQSVEDGTLDGKALKAAYHTARAERIKRKETAPQNSHDAGGKAETEVSQEGFTAAQVSMMLANYADWMPRFIGKDLPAKAKAKYVTEFPVETGETAHARRLDGLMLETYSVDEHDYDSVMLHGFEIKVTKSDLTNDRKMGDYPQFCDYFTLVVPESLFKDALDIVPEDWGIFTVGHGEMSNADYLNIARPPKCKKGTMREYTLMRYIRKYSLKSK